MISIKSFSHLLMLALIVAASLVVQPSSAFWLTQFQRGHNINSLSAFGTDPTTPATVTIGRRRIPTTSIFSDTDRRRQRTIKPSSPTLLPARHGTTDDDNDSEQDNQPPPPHRQEATIRLAESGKEVTLISRTIPVFPNASVTVWEWKNSATVVNAYWEA